MAESPGGILEAVLDRILEDPQLEAWLYAARVGDVPPSTPLPFVIAKEESSVSELQSDGMDLIDLTFGTEVNAETYHDCRKIRDLLRAVVLHRPKYRLEDGQMTTVRPSSPGLIPRLPELSESGARVYRANPTFACMIPMKVR